MDNVFSDDKIEQIKVLEKKIIKVRTEITDLQGRSIIAGSDYRRDIRKLRWKEIKLRKRIEDLRKLC